MKNIGAINRMKTIQVLIEQTKLKLVQEERTKIHP